MVLGRTKPQLSKTTHPENDENGPDIVQQKSIEPVDHWAFLDEIEAPMWADLPLEAKSTYQEKDNEWFHVTHPFHQCSSRQLISAFSHTGEGCKILDIGKQIPSSPKLPPSVSRSRGKHYKSKEWRQNNCRVISKKQHPVNTLSSKSSRSNAGTGKEMKLKSSYGLSKPQAALQAGSVCESILTETHSKLPSNFGDPSCSSSLAIKKGESSSTSTITFESGLSEAAGSKFYKTISSFRSLTIKTSENNLASTITSANIEQQKSLEVSSHLFGRKSELMSSLKVGLRKSCVTRQASRVLINGGRQSEGRKSSSSKSSVGSSSYHSYEVENPTLASTQNRDRTPDSKNVMIMPRVMKQKVKAPDMYRAPYFQVRDRTSGSKGQGETIASKSNNWGNAKSKVQSHNVHSKGLVPRNANKQDPLLATTKAKDKVVGIGWGKRLAVGGKENAIGRLDVSQKSSTREVSGGVVMKRNVSQKSNRTKLIGPKEKCRVGTEGTTKSTNMTRLR